MASCLTRARARHPTHTVLIAELKGDFVSFYAHRVARQTGAMSHGIRIPNRSGDDHCGVQVPGRGLRQRSGTLASVLKTRPTTPALFHGTVPLVKRIMRCQCRAMHEMKDMSGLYTLCHILCRPPPGSEMIQNCVARSKVTKGHFGKAGLRSQGRLQSFSMLITLSKRFGIPFVSWHVEKAATEFLDERPKDDQPFSYSVNFMKCTSPLPPSDFIHHPSKSSTRLIGRARCRGWAIWTSAGSLSLEEYR